MPDAVVRTLGNLLRVLPIALVVVALGWVVHLVLALLDLAVRKARRRGDGARRPSWPVRSRLAPWVFGAAGVLLMTAVAWGSWLGSASVAVTRTVAEVDGLAPEFEGLRVVHLSDFHAAWLARQGADLWAKVAQRANALRPDVLVFTGDYGTPAEMAAAPALLERIHARLGRFAVLGNHDYGHMERADDNWSSPEAKLALEAALRDSYRARGVTLLINEAADLRIGRSRLTLAGMGVYDPHHGFRDARPVLGPATILLAHSPQYWDAEVRDQRPVALTLTGHTHGGQVALGSRERSWSPASLMFPRWRGLHRAGRQCLYVNTGIGVYGFPVRFNMPPEVALIELRKGPS
jgi:predicted MPP superfamily phosphohydrolase